MIIIVTPPPLPPTVEPEIVFVPHDFFVVGNEKDTTTLYLVSAHDPY